MSEQKPIKKESFRSRVHEVIFEADTRLGRIFDISLLVLILLSVAALMLESVSQVEAKYGRELEILDWVITILFAIEYALRIYAVRKPWKYIFSFYGLVDLLAILPTFISPFVSNASVLGNVRILRLFRVFRVLKLAPYLIESTILVTAIRRSARKISVFLGMVLIIVVMVGSVMYFIEGQSNEKFSSIPRAMYWAIVTVTTVGYGDITPETSIGQFFSALLMILGYGVLAVPTGIVSVEMRNADDAFSLNTISCESCGREGHDDDAVHCKFCGEVL
jgi:voltage-gated potassium channel